MNWKKHSAFEGMHAYLSPSGHSWLNYDEDKLISVYKNSLMKERGTKLHQIAKDLIDNRIRLPKNDNTFNCYVNDAIGYRMRAEVMLFYSENCFGTADTISFSEKKKLLRIHDLKTGQTKASMDQLMIYDALFCLDYGFAANDITSELRIYQNNDVIIEYPDRDNIRRIIDKIVFADKVIERIRSEEGF